jgi:outer membrane protein assembly factor BamC
LTLLSACGIVSDKKVEYKKTRATNTLEVPPALALARKDDLAIPGGADVSYTDYERDAHTQGSATRTGNALDLPDGMQFKRDGNARWLSVAEAPQTLWPKVRQFWLDNGFELKREEARLGIMETGWKENRANIPSDVVRRTVGKLLDFAYDSGTRDRYKTRLESLEAGTTDIYIAHQGVEEVSQNDSFVWQPRPSDPDLEAEMLTRLMVFLGAGKETAQQQMAQTEQTQVQQKLNLSRSQTGVPQIVYPAAFAQAWLQLGLALDRGGFTVKDRNRAAGDYYVRYVGKEIEEKRGFLSKLAFWRDSDAEKKKVYRLHLEQTANNSIIQVVAQDDKTPAAERAEQILTVLLEHLH